MKTVNLFFYTGDVWHNAVGNMARQLVARSHATDFEIVFGDTEGDGDLVHYFDSGPAIQGRRPGLMGIHQISPRMPGRMLGDRAPALRRHLGAVVLTTVMAEQVREHNKRVYVIPGCVHERFEPTGVDERIARIGQVPFTVGIVGHQRHGKFDTKGREALENVIGLCPELRYKIVGHGWTDIASEHRALGHDVWLTELQHENMPDFYRDLDALLCLSREEGGGLPILEALACGVPVVSTRVGYADALDFPDFAVHVVDFLDDEFLADAAQIGTQLQFLQKEREDLTRCGAGLAALVADMTWQRCVDRHEAMFREVLGA